MKRTTTTVAQHSAAAIRAFYEKGEALFSAEGSAEFRQTAARVRLEMHTARLARQFADPDLGYTTKELDELCRLLETTPPAGAAAAQARNAKWRFGTTHVIRLLAVPRRDRKEVQRKAIKNRWSVARLMTEVARRYGVRKSGGRSRSVAEDEEGLMTQIELLCESWRRFLLAADPERSAEAVVKTAGHAIVDELPDKVKAQTRLVGQEVRRLQEMVTDELGERNPHRSARPPFAVAVPAAKAPPSRARG